MREFQGWYKATGRGQIMANNRIEGKKSSRLNWWKKRIKERLEIEPTKDLVAKEINNHQRWHV